MDRLDSPNVVGQGPARPTESGVITSTYSKSTEFFARSLPSPANRSSFVLVTATQQPETKGKTMTTNYPRRPAYVPARTVEAPVKPMTEAERQVAKKELERRYQEMLDNDPPWMNREIAKADRRPARPFGHNR